MQKVFRVTVDISKKIPAPAFEVNTNDLKSVKLEITITNGLSLLDLTDVTPRINIRKPDNEVIFQDCEIVDAKAGKVQIVLENQAYLVPGTHTAEIACYKGNEITAITGTFSYKSVKGIMNDEAVESKSEFTAIDRKIEEARKLLEDIGENGVGVDEQARQKIEEVTTQLADIGEQTNRITPVIQPTQPTNPFEGMIWFDTSRNREFFDDFNAVDNTIPHQMNYSVLKRSVAANGSVLSADSDIRIIGNKVNMKAKDTDLNTGSGIDAYADTTLLFNTPLDLSKGDITVEFDSVIEVIPSIPSILRSFEVRYTDVRASVRSGENTWVRVNFTDGNQISVSNWKNNAQTTDPNSSSNKLDNTSHRWRILFRRADKRILVYKDGIQILVTNTDIIPLSLGFVELVCSNKNNGVTGAFTDVNIDNLAIKYTE